MRHSCEALVFCVSLICEQNKRPTTLLTLSRRTLAILVTCGKSQVLLVYQKIQSFKRHLSMFLRGRKCIFWRALSVVAVHVLRANAFVPVSPTFRLASLVLQTSQDDSQEDSTIPQLPAIGESSFGAGNPAADTTSSSSHIASSSSEASAFVGAKFELQYTCKVCDTRNSHRISRLGTDALHTWCCPAMRCVIERNGIAHSKVCFSFSFQQLHIIYSVSKWGRHHGMQGL